MSSPRVALLDDHPVFRFGARMWLERAGITVVGEAGTIDEFEALLDGASIDVAIIDVALPDGDAIDALATLRQRAPNARFLVVTSHDDTFTQLRAARQGADGFVPKETDPQHLAEIVRAMVAGRTPDMRLRNQDPITLTPREVEVLSLVAKGLSNPQIARRLLVSPETVKSHIQSTFSKLTVSDRTSAVVRAKELRLIG